eukprot:383236-Prorocentrum_minimum.AAC.1
MSYDEKPDARRADWRTNGVADVSLFDIRVASRKHERRTSIQRSRGRALEAPELAQSDQK